MRLIPPESATILGRHAQAYTTPVIRSTTAAVTRPTRSRPWTVKSTRTMAATMNHAQDKMTDPALRNTSGSLSGSFRDDFRCDNTTGLHGRCGGHTTAPRARAPASRNPAPAHCMPSAGVVFVNGTRALRLRLSRDGQPTRDCGKCGGGHEPYSYGDGSLINVEHRLMNVKVLSRIRRPRAKPGIRSGNRLQ